MKFLVAYDGGSASQHALSLAREQALAGRGATLVYIVTSMEAMRFRLWSRLESRYLRLPHSP